MAESYGTVGATVPESDDYASGGADVPKAFRDYSNTFGLSQGAGKILVVQSTGAAAWKAMSGDATINADGVFDIGEHKVGEKELSTAGVTTPKIKDGAVAETKLADDAVTAAKIAEGAVGSSEIAEGAVGESELADGAVTSRKFKPVAGIVVPSTDLVLTGSYADVPGASLSITPAVASILYVQLVVRRVSGTGPVSATLKVDAGSDLSPDALIGEATGSWGQEGASQVYAIALTATAHTIKMRACRETGTATLSRETSRFFYQLVAS